MKTHDVSGYLKNNCGYIYYKTNELKMARDVWSEMYTLRAIQRRRTGVGEQCCQRVYLGGRKFFGNCKKII